MLLKSNYNTSTKNVGKWSWQWRERPFLMENSINWLGANFELFLLLRKFGKICMCQEEDVEFRWFQNVIKVAKLQFGTPVMFWNENGKQLWPWIFSRYKRKQLFCPRKGIFCATLYLKNLSWVGKKGIKVESSVTRKDARKMDAWRLIFTLPSYFWPLLLMELEMWAGSQGRWRFHPLRIHTPCLWNQPPIVCSM